MKLEPRQRVHSKWLHIVLMVSLFLGIGIGLPVSGRTEKSELQLLEVEPGEPITSFTARNDWTSRGSLTTEYGRITAGRHRVVISGEGWSTREYLTRFSSISFRDGIVDYASLNPQTSYLNLKEAAEVVALELEKLQQLGFAPDLKANPKASRLGEKIDSQSQFFLHHGPVVAFIYLKKAGDSEETSGLFLIELEFNIKTKNE